MTMCRHFATQRPFTAVTTTRTCYGAPRLHTCLYTCALTMSLDLAAVEQAVPGLVEALVTRLRVERLHKIRHLRSRARHGQASAVSASRRTCVWMHRSALCRSADQQTFSGCYQPRRHLRDGGLHMDVLAADGIDHAVPVVLGDLVLLVGVVEVLLRSHPLLILLRESRVKYYIYRAAWP
jgi:hypothetical protein